MHLSLVAGLKILQLLCLTSCRLDVASDLLPSCGITSNSNSYSFCNCLDGLQRQGICIAHSMCVGFWTVPGNVPWLVTVVTSPRGVLGLRMIQVHGLQVCSQLAAGGRGCGWRAGGGWSRGRWSDRACWSCSGVLGHCCLRTGGIESPPLVVKDRGLALPLSPSPGHQTQLVDALPQVQVEHLLEMVDQPDISQP